MMTGDHIRRAFIIQMIKFTNVKHLLWAAEKHLPSLTLITENSLETHLYFYAYKQTSKVKPGAQAQYLYIFLE